LGAAGAIEAIATIKSIETSTISPIINTLNVDKDISSELGLVIQNPEKRKINVGISNTFGFGGHNAVVAFKNISY
jgi:3-oxoacyl-[acyl-carrier-protein] synthase II